MGRAEQTGRAGDDVDGAAHTLYGAHSGDVGPLFGGITALEDAPGPSSSGSAFDLLDDDLLDGAPVALAVLAVCAGRIADRSVAGN